MKIFIDCEWNDYKGALISMALVDMAGREFYMALPCRTPTPWVAEHVMPIIGIEPVSLGELQGKLEQWLAQYRGGIEIVCDWPEDAAHFCRALIIEAGRRINHPPMTITVLQDFEGDSLQPHNALADARALRLAYMEWVS